MSEYVKTFRKAASRGVIGALMLSTAACGTMNLNPQQGRAIGEGLGTAVGAGAGVFASQAAGSGNGWGQVLGAALGAFSLRQVGGALGEAAAANNGSCQRVIGRDNTTGQIIVDNSNCQQQHGMPVGTPGVRY